MGGGGLIFVKVAFVVVYSASCTFGLDNSISGTKFSEVNLVLFLRIFNCLNGVTNGIQIWVLNI